MGLTRLYLLLNQKKIDDTYSSWQNVLYVVPQGLILGPLVFNIVLCILFVSHIEL